jgi:hypothetical protein
VVIRSPEAECGKFTDEEFGDNRMRATAQQNQGNFFVCLWLKPHGNDFAQNVADEYEGGSKKI